MKHFAIVALVAIVFGVALTGVDARQERERHPGSDHDLQLHDFKFKKAGKFEKIPGDHQNKFKPGFPRSHDGNEIKKPLNFDKQHHGLPKQMDSKDQPEMKKMEPRDIHMTQQGRQQRQHGYQNMNMKEFRPQQHQQQGGKGFQKQNPGFHHNGLKEMKKPNIPQGHQQGQGRPQVSQDHKNMNMKHFGPQQHHQQGGMGVQKQNPGSQHNGPKGMKKPSIPQGHQQGQGRPQLPQGHKNMNMKHFGPQQHQHQGGMGVQKQNPGSQHNGPKGMKKPNIPQGHQQRQGQPQFPQRSHNMNKQHFRPQHQQQHGGKKQRPSGGFQRHSVRRPQFSNSGFSHLG